jgi:hypothetical protein
MSEAELIMLQVELLNVAWVALQAWVGATFAMIAAAHFAIGSFNWFLLSGMLSLYSLFTAGIVLQINRLIDRIKAIVEDLYALQESGIELGNSAQHLIERMEAGVLIYYVNLLIPVIGIASLAYVLYCRKQ